MKTPVFTCCAIVGSIFSLAARQPLQVYVDVHGSGLSPDPTDFALPLATIGEALNRVGENDLIRVGEGVFKEFDLQIDASIGIIGEGPDKTIIRGGATPGVAGGGILSTDPGHRVLIDGVGITNGVANPAAPGAGSGGGIYNGGTLTITNTTILDNAAGDGGPTSGVGGSGGAFDSTIATGPCRIRNSTIVGNLIGDSGFFMIENPTLGDLSGVDPILGALADNGGPTPSLLPQPGSPTIGAITLGITPTTIDDQRGFLRIEPTTIGAVDPGATPPAIGGSPRLTIEMPRGATQVTLGRLMLDRSQQSMHYQLFVGDDPGQLAIPEGMPGGRVSLSSPQAGTGAPLLWDVPFLAPLFRADGSRKRHAELIIIVTPRIIIPPE